MREIDEVRAIDEQIELRGMWGEHPMYPRARWKERVASDETLLSYWHWVVRMIEWDHGLSPVSDGSNLRDVATMKHV